MDMDVAQAGKESKITAEGNVTPPRAGWSLEGTSGELDIDVNDLDLGFACAFACDGRSWYTGTGENLSKDQPAKSITEKFKPSTASSREKTLR